MCLKVHTNKSTLNEQSSPIPTSRHYQLIICSGRLWQRCKTLQCAALLKRIPALRRLEVRCKLSAGGNICIVFAHHFPPSPLYQKCSFALLAQLRVAIRQRFGQKLAIVIVDDRWDETEGCMRLNGGKRALTHLYTVHLSSCPAAIIAGAISSLVLSSSNDKCIVAAAPVSSDCTCTRRSSPSSTLCST